MGKIKQYLKLIFHGHYDTSTPEGRNNERLRNIALTAMSAMLAKVIAMIVPLVTVRITLSYMGEEIYGLWSTVTSFFTMFAFADLGLGSGLQTELSKASALDDNAICKKLVSSTYTILTSVAAVLVIIFLIAYPIVDWASVINAETEQAIALVGSVVLAIVIPRFLNIPLALIQRTQTAMQEGYKTNIWQCAGNLLSLIAVIVIYYVDLGVLTMIWAYSMITVVVALVNMIVYFKWERPELTPSIKFFDKKISKRMLSTGINFFVLSIFTSMSLSIDNFIVARTCSLADVTPYSVMYKIVHLISVVSVMLSTPMWAANGEAMQRGEFSWVKKTTRNIVLISLVLSVVASLGIFLLIKPALKILSDGMVVANYALLIPMCLMQVAVSVTNPYFMILNAGRIIKYQIVTYVIYAAVTLPLKFVLGSSFGMIAITWVGVIGYFALLTIPTFIRAMGFLKEEERTFKLYDEKEVKNDL